MPPASERRDLMRAIVRALSNDISASTSDIAAAAGIGRTTLHRTFGTRAELMRATAEFVLEESERLAAAIRLDEGPPAEVLEALAAEHSDWGLICGLLWYGNALSDEVDVLGAAELFDARVDRFIERAQAAGVLRADHPPRWITYSIGSLALSAHYAVDGGFVGERAAASLFLGGLLGGFGPPPAG